MICQGKGVSPGVAVGQVYIYAPHVLHARSEFAQSVSAEKEAYAAARIAAQKQLRELQNRLKEQDAEKAAIFDAHLDLLDDEVIVEEIELAIEEKKNEAGFAIEQVYDRYARMMAAVEDETLSQRADDLADVCQRLLRQIYGVPEQDLSCLPGPVIVAAEDLLPSDTASLDRRNVLGIVTCKGGATSHSAIIARSWEIPAVLGIADLLTQVRDGDVVILDAMAGTLDTTPDDFARNQALQKREAWLKDAELARRFLTVKGATADGVAVHIGLNLGGLQDDELAGAQATEFVGLLRTEFLYMETDHMPTEDEQCMAYETELREWGSREVTVRTLDIGGDKTLPYFALPKEENPFLGQRALRLCFAHPEILQTQFRAALRAAVHGNLWLMLPMVSGVEDFERSRRLLDQTRDELVAQGVEIGCVKLGVMIETPAMVLMAPEIAAVADFASIGTNDLCQYLTAADRMNPSVAEYCSPFHPALYRAVAMTVQAFQKANKPLCVCGELAGDEYASCILIGLGLRKLSMSLSQVARVKRALSRYTVSEMEAMAGQILGCANSQEVLQCIQQIQSAQKN